MEQSRRWRRCLLAVGVGAATLCGCGGSGSSNSASAQAAARKNLVAKRTAVKTEVKGEQPLSHPPTTATDEP
jgi:hypothetical protein